MVVVISKCDVYDVSKIQKVIEDSFSKLAITFKKNSVFVIKPNLLVASKLEQAVTTHPAVVEAVCKIITPFAKKIVIGDSSGNETDKTLEVSGMNSLKKYADVVNFEVLDKQKVRVRDTDLELPKILFEADYIINVAKLKTHILTNATLCTKNLYGCIPGRMKAILHKEYSGTDNFAKLVVALKNKINPTINIVDGILGLEGNGPGSAGTPKSANTIVVGQTPLETDIVACQIMGFKPKEVTTIKHDVSVDVSVIGKIENLNFKKPNSVVSRLSGLVALFPKPKIVFDEEKCVRCNLCAKKCPVNALVINKDKPNTWDKSLCVYCMCCVELCPHDSVHLKKPFVEEMMRKFV